MKVRIYTFERRWQIKWLFPWQYVQYLSWRETLLEVHSPALSWHAYFRLPVCRDGATTSEMLPRDKEQTLSQVQVLPRRPRSENPHLWRGNEEVLGGCVPHLRTSRKVKPRKGFTLPFSPSPFSPAYFDMSTCNANCSRRDVHYRHAAARRLGEFLGFCQAHRAVERRVNYRCVTGCSRATSRRDLKIFTFFPAYFFNFSMKCCLCTILARWNLHIEALLGLLSSSAVVIFHARADPRLIS